MQLHPIYYINATHPNDNLLETSDKLKRVHWDTGCPSLGEKGETDYSSSKWIENERYVHNVFSKLKGL